jgi:exodeoxyribonuclease V alpha subunit
MTLESADFTISAIMFHKVGDYSKTGIPYLIAATNEGHTVKGEIYDPVKGDTYRLYGEWNDDPRSHTKKCFVFHSYETLVDRSVSGVVNYLYRHIDGIGSVKAKAIVDHFGPDCFDILRATPSRANEVRGINDSLVQSIKEHFESCKSVDPKVYAELYDLVSRFKIARSTLASIISDFESNTIPILRDNPYILMNYSGLGWKTVDGIAIGSLKYDRKGVHRFRAAILECLNRRADEGDTYCERPLLKVSTQTLAGLGPFDEALASLHDDGLIEIEKMPDGQEFVAEQSLAYAEREIAYRLKGLTESFVNKPIEFDTTSLEDEQIEAIRFLEQNPIAILTGGAGCGKTTTIVNVLKTLSHNHHSVIISTPTGKAAKRVAEVLEEKIPGSGIIPSTIHRLLGSIGSGAPLGVPAENAKFGRERKEFGFSHDESNYLKINDAFIDESSMVDASLLASYLRAISPNTRLVMVGDENQLPSVGAGACLRDMIMGGIPTFSLTKPRRNSGRIVHACHAIRDGKVPIPSAEFDPERGENWIHLEESDPAAIADRIVQLHTQTDRDPLWDLQVISAQNSRLPIACSNLNKLLSKHFNPNSHSQPTKEDGTTEEYSRYDINDKVVRKKNGMVSLMIPLDVGAAGVENWDDFDDFSPSLLSLGSQESDIVGWRNRDYQLAKTYVVNGDIGQVLDIIPRPRSGKQVVVRFFNPDRICLIPYGESHLSLAYCITVHVSQGSGFPVVIFPVHDSYYWDSRNDVGLLHSELLNTAFSRAEQVLITVGTMSSIRKAVSRKTVHKRKTRLARFIRQEFGQTEQ